MKGYIHSFESLAAVDGLGLRCAVFLSGCPLRCVYCHNPDTWEGSGEEIDAETLVKKIARFKPY
ncbi:MAG: 4Fe-4S cluster-binding domain-containing protein, partial [Clostridia bacterium]|nr:4Fe-4S cluster-binding domain-containing protein [Clostridia bacterium]